MADKGTEQSDLEPKAPLPSDAELFAGDVQNDYTAQDIFAGDDLLYKALAEPAQPGGETPAPTVSNNLRQIKPRLSHLTGARFSRLQKGLASAILGVAIILAWAVFKTPRNSSADADLTPPPEINELQTPTVVVQAPAASQADLANDIPGPDPAELNDAQEIRPRPSAPDTAISLKVAQEMFEGGQYRRAYSVYHQIQQYLPPTNSETAFYDFLNLHKGLCLAMNLESMEAKRALSQAAKSQVPTIRVMANYHLSVLELSQNQFMPARTRACAALGLLDALPAQDPQWVLELKQTCCYLVAEATSKQALILCNADKQLPSELCPVLPVVTTPWHNLSETQIHESLAKENDLLPSILLSPSFSTDVKKPQFPWSVACHRMAVDELLARFGAAASMEVIWHDEANSSSLRKQAISLYVKDVSDQTALSLAAGAAGLLVQVGDDRVMHVRNPVTASLVSDQVSMLALEGTAMWQRYLFSHTESPHFAIAHFFSGLLYKQLSLRTEALSEF
ncbi:MAG: hypothetical protein GY809_32775, partial [Planctomycetes bacterium]|nr:hypothetical protein [Planctomycetota bacterium]